MRLARGALLRIRTTEEERNKGPHVGAKRAKASDGNVYIDVLRRVAMWVPHLRYSRDKESREHIALCDVYVYQSKHYTGAKCRALQMSNRHVYDAGAKAGAQVAAGVYEIPANSNEAEWPSLLIGLLICIFAGSRRKLRRLE